MLLPKAVASQSPSVHVLHRAHSRTVSIRRGAFIQHAAIAAGTSRPRMRDDARRRDARPRIPAALSVKPCEQGSLEPCQSCRRSSAERRPAPDWSTGWRTGGATPQARTLSDLTASVGLLQPFVFFAFSSRGPVSTSLENALSQRQAAPSRLRRHRRRQAPAHPCPRGPVMACARGAGSDVQLLFGNDYEVYFNLRNIQ
jgi:hypothetical protein